MYLAKSLDKKHIDGEKKRHDKALERYQQDMGEWEKKRRQYQDWLAERYENKKLADDDLHDTDYAFTLYNLVVAETNDYDRPIHSTTSNRHHIGNVFHIPEQSAHGNLIVVSYDTPPIEWRRGQYNRCEMQTPVICIIKQKADFGESCSPSLVVFKDFRKVLPLSVATRSGEGLVDLSRLRRSLHDLNGSLRSHIWDLQERSTCGKSNVSAEMNPTDIFYHSCPLRIKVKTHPTDKPWFTPEIKEAIANRQRAWVKGNSVSLVYILAKKADKIMGNNTSIDLTGAFGGGNRSNNTNSTGESSNGFGFGGRPAQDRDAVDAQAFTALFLQLFIIIFNIMMIIVFQLRLKSIPYIMIQNIFIIDLLSALLPGAMWSIGVQLDNLPWQMLLTSLCQLQGFLNCFLFSGFLFTIALISGSQLLTLAAPGMYKKLFKETLVTRLFLGLAVWMLSGLLATFPVSSQWGMYATFGANCWMTWVTANDILLSFNVFTTCLTLGPAVAMVTVLVIVLMARHIITNNTILSLPSSQSSLGYHHQLYHHIIALSTTSSSTTCIIINTTTNYIIITSSPPLSSLSTTTHKDHQIINIIIIIAIIIAIAITTNYVTAVSLSSST
ncbi:hypothetical protein QZH41_004300 [Actinostola sp. cb2023]|nr:hypothetical protein QZH41_004300 [Actinostola sp. cb2023]